MRRPYVLFLLVLVVAGGAVFLNSYVDQETDKIVANAPDPEDEAEQEAKEVSTVDSAGCERAHAAFDEAWDKSLENPDDQEYEQLLDEALGEVTVACEGS